MPKGAERAIKAFREHYSNEDVKIPTALRSEPPDIIFTGLMEPEEVRTPELVDVMPSREPTPPPTFDPLAQPTSMDAPVPAEDPFGDLDLGDVLTQ